MSEKEYIVSLNKGVNYEAFNQEMIAATGAGDIPGRSVTVANARPASQRNTHYSLTDAEAEALKNDPRVYGVTLLPELDPNLVIEPRAIQTGDFTKTTLDRGEFLNWGMRRMNATANPYVGNIVSGGYNYTLDGTGVDIVIQDSGIQADHPEFQDANGVSRVQEINWTTASGIPGMPSQNANYYRDYDGHGTHVAGTAAGKTYGWAKNARIYSMKVSGLEGFGDSGTGTSVTYVFDAIKQWHNSKPVDPATGAKRPTVVNMSWGYLRYYNSVTSMTYRGTTYTGGDIDTTTKRWNFGLPPTTRGLSYATNVRIASVDTDIEELIDAGVHVMIAAGNRSHKIDVPGGDDYDNVLVANTGSVEYNRGSSPYSIRAHIVGNIDSAIDSGGLEQKASSSETGPGVSVYAPGTDIMSAMSTTNAFGATTLNNPYPANSSYLINNISGTSMASPQIAGVTSLWLQLNPEATPEQGLNFINTVAQSAKIYNPGTDTDYTNTRSLLGGNNRFGFNKFNSETQMSFGTVETFNQNEQATYLLSASAASVNEGGSVTITLNTTNVTNGSSVGYNLTGIESDDITEALTGTFLINNNTASKTFNIVNDLTTEGSQTMTLSLVGITESVAVLINDTSLTPVVPSYSVVPVATEVNEGADLDINVTTTNVTDATTLYWTVTAPGEFNVSSGSFTINSNAGSFSVTPAADALTEGIETFSISVRTGSVSGPVVATTDPITINDTSTTPSGTVYNVTVASGTNQYGTGNKYYIDGLSGASPTLSLIEGQTYVFRQNDSSNDTHQLLFSETANGTWGGGVEYTTGVTKVGTAGTAGAYTQITVQPGAPTLYYYCINHSGMGGTANTPGAAAGYDSVTSPASANEGDTVTFTVNTTDIQDGTTVGYTISGIDSGDLSAGSLTGNFTINSNTGTVNVTLANDVTTEGSEIMTLTLAATDSEGTTTNGISTNTTINDTSLSPGFTPDYTITVTNTGNSYNLSGTDRNGAVTGSQPTLAFNSGDNVRFNVDSGTASAHPFYIKTTQSTGTGNQVSGATGQGTTQIDWTTSTDGAGSYGYQCSIHFGMWNTITIN